MFGLTTQLYVGAATFPGWDNLTLVGNINLSIPSSPYNKLELENAIGGKRIWNNGTPNLEVLALLDRYIPNWNLTFLPSFTAPNFNGAAKLAPENYTGMFGGRYEFATLASSHIGEKWYIKLSETEYICPRYAINNAGDLPRLQEVVLASDTASIMKYGVVSYGYMCPAGGAWPSGSGTNHPWQTACGFPVICSDGVAGFGWTTYDTGGTVSINVIRRGSDYRNISELASYFQPNWRPETDPYENNPISGDVPLPGGGSVGIPGFPGLTATSAGVIGLFAPTAAQMQLLADFMWTDFGGTGTTVEEILQEVVEALKRSISNPLDYIIGLNIIPSQGLSIGATKVVRFGFISSGVSMPQLANQYFTVDCGTLSFDTVCGDTFLDYAPYSKFSIYLPYIGFKDVDPNDFVGHTIGVVYHGDCVTGGVTAYITKDGTVMYQYSGCCALNVPLSADNWGETISAAINVATGIVAAAASGGAAGLAQGALKGAASVAANPSLLSPQVSHSGAVSGGAGCMGVQFPFVIREAVNFHSTAGFNRSTGYPAYYYRKLGDVTGFTTVIDAHLSDIPMATQDEIAEIESLLESGVIL